MDFLVEGNLEEDAWFLEDLEGDCFLEEGNEDPEMHGDLFTDTCTGETGGFALPDDDKLGEDNFLGGFGS